MRCLLISGSPECNSDFLKTQYKPSDFVVCADKGYEFAKKASIKPDLIIGDFDSCSLSLPSDLEVIRLNPQKDDTDTLSAIKAAVKKGCSEFLLLGALGGRLDHTYGNLSLLYFLEKNNIKAEIRTEKETIKMISNNSSTFQDVKGKTFSVFVYGCESAMVTYKGKVAYPVKDYLMTADYPIGVSNVFLENSAEIQSNNGTVMVIVNNRI